MIKRTRLLITIGWLSVICMMILTSCGPDNTATPGASATNTPAANASTATPGAGSSMTATPATSASTATPGASTGGKIIKIALANAITGAGATQGLDNVHGSELAIDECNAKQCVPGYTIVGVQQDDKTDSTEAASVAQRIIADPLIFGVIGHTYSGLSLAALPTYKGANLAVISPSATNTKLTSGDYPNFFRTCTRDDVQGPAGADYIADTLKLKNVFMVHSDNAYANGLTDDFKKEAAKKGLTIVGDEKVPDKATEYSDVINKISASTPDIVVFPGYFYEAGPYLKQAADKGINIKLLGFDGIDDAKLVELAGPAANNASFTSVGPNATTVWPAERINAYKTKYNANPGTYTPSAYDATNILLAAIAKVVQAQGTPDRAAIIQAVAATKDYEATTGKMSFDAHGDTTNKTIYIYQIQGAKYPGVQVAKTSSGQ